MHTLSCPLCEYTSDHKADIDNHLDMDHHGSGISAAAAGDAPRGSLIVID